MYKLLTLTLLVFSLAFQQGSSNTLPKIICKVYADDQWVEQELEKRPEFRNGEQDLFKFLGMNARYPATAQRAGISGTVLITAEVTEDGRLINEKVEKGRDPDLDKEALRVIKLMPDEWTPGTLNGETVRVQVTIPVMFVIAG